MSAAAATQLPGSALRPESACHDIDFSPSFGPSHFPAKRSICELQFVHETPSTKASRPLLPVACGQCGTTETTVLRRGPDGRANLCNRYQVLRLSHELTLIADVGCDGAESCGGERTPSDECQCSQSSMTRRSPKLPLPLHDVDEGHAAMSLPIA